MIRDGVTARCSLIGDFFGPAIQISLKIMSPLGVVRVRD